MITAVCGFGRCGSSLVMQMLASGGMKTPYSSYPSYEIPNGTQIHYQALKGGAIKILDPHLHPRSFHHSFNYQFIWIDRDPREQAKSMAKLFAAFMPHLAPWTGKQIEQCAESFIKDRPKAIGLLHSLSQRVLKLRFEEILAEPKRTARTLSVFCEGLVRKAMAKRVQERGPECLPHLMELEMMKEKEQGCY